ncbi:hypothetical protein DLAC_04092 [Tieghemostelium lacteum]|uniref:Tc1-like transposase DDE domain-containing protein n=1 Tax=Tieghemostelium lacteum TaxID=361077 RepID=A0A151ZS79_TIELA|nr:hypothetical protein DLAC_04092 [Tieghemostelium lacteum]|eukprot:KYQ96792.1 hypothetical protein DLAC_04092 [Tieghemostelium lacteum]
MSLSSTIRKTTEISGLPKSSIKYWRRKLRDPSFHSKSWGGTRGCHLTQVQRIGAAKIIESYVRDILREMNWCFKVPEYKQVHKFTQDNMVLHAGHLFYTNTNDWSRYVFLDEVHFNSRDLRKRRVLGPRNERVHVTTNTSLSMSFSMSAMVRCDGTFFLSPYRDTNDQYNARDFILESIRCGFLKKGDILFMDNAAVHLGSDTFPVLCLVLEELQITLKFLPAYSPELNPIELCFGLNRAIPPLTIVNSNVKVNDHTNSTLSESKNLRIQLETIRKNKHSIYRNSRLNDKKSYNIDDIQKISKLNEKSKDYFESLPRDQQISKGNIHTISSSILNPESLGRKCLELTNQYRKSKGIVNWELLWNPQLFKIACQHSRDMAECKVPFGHQGFNDRVKQYPFYSSGAAENVAYNNCESSAAQVTVDGWIKSPGHQKNLVGNFNICSIGVHQSSDGKWYFTQLFGSKK